MNNSTAIKFVLAMLVLMFIAFLLLITLAQAQPVIIRPPPRPPIVVTPPPYVVPVIPPEPRCHIVRETTHDDILGTNNYVEREECE